MLETRSDIVYIISLISRYSVNSTQTHWNTVIRIFRYLRDTMHYELVYKESLQALIEYIDFDWADDSTRRSIFDYLFNVDSDVISWLSKRQVIVALFTCEVEYIDQTLTIKEVIWLKTLLNQLLRPRNSNPKIIIIFDDNQSAIALIKNA